MKGIGWKYYTSHQIYSSIEYGVYEIIKSNEYKEEVADAILNLYDYMITNKWIGACHAVSAVLYIALKELGCNVTIKIGECKFEGGLPFDHSWIEIDEKNIDLAIFMPLDENMGKYGSLNICGFDVLTMAPHKVLYGVNSGRPFSRETEVAIKSSLSKYMDLFPGEKGGLWTVLDNIYPYENELNICQLKLKYDSIFRDLVR